MCTPLGSTSPASPLVKLIDVTESWIESPESANFLWCLALKLAFVCLLVRTLSHLIAYVLTSHPVWIVMSFVFCDLKANIVAAARSLLNRIMRSFALICSVSWKCRVQRYINIQGVSKSNFAWGSVGIPLCPTLYPPGTQWDEWAVRGRTIHNTCSLMETAMGPTWG